ncbi:MAG: hypothetical protein ABFD89_01635 [Bryobacteraceae bacterium]
MGEKIVRTRPGSEAAALGSPATVADPEARQLIATIHQNILALERRLTELEEKPQTSSMLTHVDVMDRRVDQYNGKTETFFKRLSFADGKLVVVGESTPNCELQGGDTTVINTGGTTTTERVSVLLVGWMGLTQ